MSLLKALPREIDTHASQDVQKGLEQLELRREATRDILARRVLWLLSGSLICSFIILGGVVFIKGSDKETAKDLVALILTSQTGLVGTVLGFYFGTQR